MVPGAGVALGRESSSATGGDVAPLLCAALLTAFSGSWIPIAAYMTVVAGVSLVATRLSPEALDRGLNTPEDATAPLPEPPGFPKPALHRNVRPGASDTCD